MAVPDGEPVYFGSAEEFEAWLEENHESADDVWVGHWRKGSGETGVTVGEAQNVAVRFGWVDSLQRRVDDRSYKLRFTPRRPGSNWTEKNIAIAEGLIAEGRMTPLGLRAFEARKK